MATVVLQTVGAAIGGAIAGPIGAVVGRAAGALAGSAVDQKLFSKDRVVDGPRLDASRILSSTEGTPIPKVYGRQRLAGQIIWATRFTEVVGQERTSGKGGGGSTTTSRNYSYFASFAIALCDGDISGVRRIWADGQEIDQESLEFRTYSGSETQDRDPLIEAKQGTENTPAYRGTAYIVFEDFPLANYGNRIPQLAFEIIRGVGKLEREIQSITVIPGATEYGYDNKAATSGGAGTPFDVLNRHSSLIGTDWTAAIDELQMVCPNLKSVSLVVTWYGNDLRAGEAVVRPGVTHQFTDNWRVAGYHRYDAHLVSQTDGRPAFGGTPSDASVLNAIADIKSRGLEVVLYPFLMMDIPEANTLLWINEANGQPAYPWRGDTSCFPPPGFTGTPDKTTVARTQVQAFSQEYVGMIQHYATLCAAAGGVDGFLIGSELRGLTRVRDNSGQFPFVEALIGLASVVRNSLGENTRISYGADWSEYFGYQPVDGTGDVFFNLDPLWADENIDAVGIDNYMPLSDWLNGQDVTDETVKSIHDPSYLSQNIAAQEGFDWYYRSTEDRNAQLRTPITDGQGEAWVFRYKDIVSWWSNSHHDRPSGIRQSTPTAWVPQSKPIWITELGCPAVSQGSNQPNVFYDRKSAQSALPYHSNGARDDLIQRRFLEAHYSHWKIPENNPVSSVYDGLMIAPQEITPWAWDARPFPWFPLSTDTWSDGENWYLGHWLNGRLGGCPVGDLILQVLEDYRIDDALIELDGVIDGYAVPGAVSAREALEPLLGLFDIAVTEADGQLVFRNPSYADRITLNEDALVQEEEQPAITVRQQPLNELPGEAVIHHVSVLNEYEDIGTKSRRLESGTRRQISLQSSAVMPASTALELAENQLQKRWAGRQEMMISLGTENIAISAGDIVRLSEENKQEWLVVSVDKGVKQELVLRSIEQESDGGTAGFPETGKVSNPLLIGPPDVVIMDLPLLSSADSQRILNHVALSANPWGTSYGVFTSPTSNGFTERTTHELQAVMGELISLLNPGVSGLWDNSARIHLNLMHGSLQSREDLLVLNGTNSLAVEKSNGQFEILQFGLAELQQDGSWILSRLLRGQLGTEDEMLMEAAAGSRAVLLDDRLLEVELGSGERGVLLNWRIGPIGFPVTSDRFTQVTHVNNGRSKRMLNPVHLMSKQTETDDILFNWVRRSRIDGDSWEDAEVPLDALEERYLIEIISLTGTVKRTATVKQPSFIYSAADQSSDLGSGPTTFEFRVAQLNDAGNPGASVQLMKSLP